MDLVKDGELLLRLAGEVVGEHADKEDLQQDLVLHVLEAGAGGRTFKSEKACKNSMRRHLATIVPEEPVHMPSVRWDEVSDLLEDFWPGHGAALAEAALHSPLPDVVELHQKYKDEYNG